MTKRLPWLLLAVSVAFNIFVAVGFFTAHHKVKQSRGFKGRTELFARHLNLTDSQRQEYDNLMQQMDQLRQSRISQREAFRQELIKDHPDQKVLEDYLTGPEACQQRLLRLEILRKMVEVLTPQQREKLLQLLKKPDAPSQ